MQFLHLKKRLGCVNCRKELVSVLTFLCVCCKGEKYRRITWSYREKTISTRCLQAVVQNTGVNIDHLFKWLTVWLCVVILLRDALQWSVAIFDAFCTTCTQPETLHTCGGGSKSRHGRPTHRNWKRKCNNMAVQSDQNSCGIAQFPCGSTAFLLFIPLLQHSMRHVVGVCLSAWL